jgi:ankyrin repeat protein/L-ascorbate metabolism protein UlaG (beta-lactamase superfamily)
MILALSLSALAFGRPPGGREVVKALEQGETDLALRLLRQDPEMLKADLGLEQGMTVLHYAAYFGNEAVVDYALKNGVELNSRDDRGLTAVWFSVSGGRPKMLQKLIRLGADLKVTNAAGDNMLFRAAKGGNAEVVRILLANGFRAGEKNKAGTPPLIAAARTDALDIVKLLESKGANLEAVSETGSTILHEAAASGKTSVLTYALDKSLDLEARDTNNLTPLQWAIGWGNTAGAIALIRRGAGVNIKGPEGATPLFTAVSMGNREVASALAESGADVNAAGDGSLTPFIFAVKKGQDDLVRIFLNKNADRESRDPWTGKTALHEAALRGYTSIVEDLLRAGAEKNARDLNGHTALSYAQKYGHRDTADVLARNDVKTAPWETNFDDAAYLRRRLKDGQAYVWYLGHSGWAVKTRSAILIFDYWDDAPPPKRKLLANGHIDPDELKTFPVYVFVSHDHADHFDRQILDWQKTVPDIHYVFGFENDAGVGAVYARPRSSRTLGPLTITTIQANDAGVGFAVQVDGLTLFHAGDHSCNSLETANNNFYPEIDFLAERGIRPDAAFFLNMYGCGMAVPEAFRKGIFYAVEKLHIKTVFPMHGADREWVYADLKEAAAEKNVRVEIQAAINRGDRFLIGGAQYPLLGPCVAQDGAPSSIPFWNVGDRACGANPRRDP